MPSPRYWREVPARFRLEASRCPACGEVAYPPRRVCPACREGHPESLRLTPRGTVITSTVLHAAPEDLALQVPYAVALVETPERARLMVQVADCDPADVEPGMAVTLQFRRIRGEGHGGILCYGYKAVPA